MDPQQELFSALLVALKKKGYDVYDGFLPPENTPYPFIYLGEGMLYDDANKTAVFGRVSQRVHVWHNNPRQRGTMSQILLAIKEVCRAIDKTQNFKWFVSAMDQRILADTTTAVPLMHGVVDVEFKFS